MLGDTVHGKEEFGDIDWDHVNKANEEGNVSFGCGGHGFPDGTWLMTIMEDTAHNDWSTDIYVLPDYLQYMINTINQWGKDESRRKISNHVVNLLSDLGLNLNH